MTIWILERSFKYFTVGQTISRAEFTMFGSSEEEHFLQIVKSGNCDSLNSFLTENQKLNINCSDFKGYHALDIAALRKEQEVMDILLSQTGITFVHVNSAISKLIKANETDLLDRLLDYYDEKFGENIYDEVREIYPSIEDYFPNGPKRSSPKKRSKSPSCRRRKSSNDVAQTTFNPMITAALCENAEIIHSLYRRGYRLYKPHHPNCKCSLCSSDKRETLSEAIGRLNIYSALSSPLYIILTSDDPVLIAFQLCDELKILGRIYAEYTDSYKQLATQCSKLAAKMLDLCQDTSEIETLLSQNDGSKDPRVKSFTRLHLAMGYEQKEFVAHPNCQQVLRSLWAEGLPNWWIWSPVRRFLHVTQHSLLTPLIIVGFILFPHAWVTRNVRVPLHRFIYASTCYAIFLILLIWSLNFDPVCYSDYQLGWKDVAITIWVLGHFWEILVNLKILGFRACFRRWWVKCDMLMYTVFFLVQTVRIWGFLTVQLTERSTEYQNQVINLLEMTNSFFAFASIVAFYRILHWYQIHKVLGPLERSLQYMILDVTRFFALIIVVMTSFGVGLTYIYRSYTKESSLDSRQDAVDFSSFYLGLLSLGWAALGLGGTKILTVTKPKNSTEIFLNSQDVNETVGQGLWLLYHVTTGVVLMNMLIAMLAESFNRVQNDADTEWKFCRSDLWLSYFDRQSTLPPPFNVIPNILELPHTLMCFKKWMKNTSNSSPRRSASWWSCQPTHTDQSQFKQMKAHKELMGKMVQRYLQAVETMKTCRTGQKGFCWDPKVENQMVLRDEIYADIRRGVD